MSHGPLVPCFSIMAVSGSEIYVSVKVLSSSRCLLSKIISSPVNSTFYQLLMRNRAEDHRVNTSALCLEKIEISEKQHGEGMEVDSTSPVSLCKEFQSKLVLF